MCGRIDRSYRISGRAVDLWRGPASCPSRGGPLKKEDKQKGDEGEFPQVKVPLSFFSRSLRWPMLAAQVLDRANHVGRVAKKS